MDDAVIKLDGLTKAHCESATICMATHEASYSSYDDRTVHLFDGRVVEETSAGANA